MDIIIFSRYSLQLIQNKLNIKIRHFASAGEIFVQDFMHPVLKPIQ